MLDFTRNTFCMTGFIFTFSLFCTAVIQADPAVMHSADANVIRHIMDAAGPTLRSQMTWTVDRYHPVTAAAFLHVAGGSTTDELSTVETFPSDNPVSAYLNSAHPIRAPATAFQQ